MGQSKEALVVAILKKESFQRLYPCLWTEEISGREFGNGTMTAINIVSS